MKLSLGTVQFGMDYGISNVHGQTDANSISKILDLAAKNSIKMLDTAPAYGVSEEVIGRVLLQDSHNFRIVTKTTKIQKNKMTLQDAETIFTDFHHSLKMLKQDSIYGLLSHHADDLLSKGGEYLYEALVDLKNRGLTEKIGVSVYDENQLCDLLEKYSFDIVQLPVSVFDQRFLRNNQLAYLKNANIEIHARSAFLQGLLLMPTDSMPNYFDPIKTHIQYYHRYLKKKQISPVRAALGFVASINEIDNIICGVNTYEHLEELINHQDALHDDELANFQLTDEAYLNPSKWKGF